VSTLLTQIQSVGKSKTLRLNSLAECSWKSSNKSVVSVNQSG